MLHYNHIAKWLYLLIVVFSNILTLKSQNLQFLKVEADHSGIHFNNQLNETKTESALIYDNFYSGGGVAIGDINNDGLPDIYFAGNQVSDKLYLNQGDFKFKDITTSSGIKEKSGWSTGVVLADVNADGWLDIYVCKSIYEADESLRTNELYINNGDPNTSGMVTFTEQAQAWGIASMQRSQQAAFFDYDKDGDLDLFLVNQPPNPGPFSPLKGYDWRKPELGCQLFKNNGTSFTDVTVAAGVSAKGYGLGVSTADFNNDGWLDIYVSNDYNSPDFLYINNQDGTFKNTLTESMGHISFFSMGIDAADINNDGLMDIAVLDMVAEDNYRLKANMGGMEPESFWQTVAEGGHYQYMFNTLQLNRGTDANGITHFSDIAQMAGTAYSDWSWSPLFADFDNDGDKDLYCTNGLVRDLRNTDALKNLGTYYKAAVQKFQTENPEVKNADIWDIIDPQVALELFPSQPLSNYFFQSTGDLKFKNIAAAAGLDDKGFSTGAAYADLDLDGDLDLVINNMNDKAWIYNNTSQGNYLRVKLSDGKQNSLFGTRVAVKSGKTTQYFELSNTRGFYSSSENIAHFGLGKYSKADEVVITWNDGTMSILKNVAANQVLEINKADTKTYSVMQDQPLPLFKNYTQEFGLDWQHEENEFDDYIREVLLPHKMSQLGPAIAVGDINKDGFEDVFIGGAKDYSPALFLQREGGIFKKIGTPIFNRDKQSEDVDAVFFDADLDGDLDLYVVSGGNEMPKADFTYDDRLYINDNLVFTKSTALPSIPISGSVAKPFDYDGDGDMDIFVGGRQVPGAYPSATSSYILKNMLKENGQLSFENVTETIAPDLINLGMVTDAIWTDYDQDGDKDILVVGEWMPITLFKNESKGSEVVFTKSIPLAKSEGWWYTAEQHDLDGDGDMDYLLGNLGLNSKYKANHQEPFSVHYDDFDGNGSYDIVLSYYNFGKKYPVRGRSCSSQQIPDLATEFPTYDLFAQADVFEVYGEDKIQQALNLDVHTFNSVWVENKGDGEFELHDLPRTAQLSTINDFLVLDHDGKKEIVLAGNMYNAEVETPRQDGNMGLVLRVSNNKMEVVPPTKSQLYLPKEVKRLVPITIKGKSYFLVATNNDKLEIWGR